MKMKISHPKAYSYLIRVRLRLTVKQSDAKKAGG
jgi:hypothetical protein